MSWAEDNGYDTYDWLDVIAKRKSLEDSWKRGIHKDKSGNIYKIEEMSDEHLHNCIKFFKRSDTTPLQNELNKRV